MNKHIIIGNLTKDPETGTTPNGVNYCRFTVAVRKRYHKDGEPEAEFIRVTAWRGIGDACAKCLKKGKKVAVYGESLCRVWEHDGNAYGQIEMTADDVEFLSPKGEGTDVTGEPLPEGWE